MTANSTHYFLGGLFVEFLLAKTPKQIAKGDLHDAEETLTTAQKEETRTPIATAACRSAFKALTESMRYIKKRWLISPPLTDADMIRLGFELADKKPTPSGPPTAKILPEIISRGQASLKIRFEYVEGNAKDKSNKSRRLHYKIIPQGETPPCQKPSAFGLEFAV